jgi:phosphatidylglycerophosphate synthase
MRDAAAAKVPSSARFLDLSDYARPLAVWIARRLQHTGLVAAHVTVVWVGVGLLGAICYGLGGYALALAGAVALQAKNVLDAVDGSLARLQARPSRVGRFLDTLGDAVVGAVLAVALAAAVARSRPTAYAVVLAAAALVLGLVQSSLYNYYYVRYRARCGGDTTSRVKEEVTALDRAHYGGRPLSLGLLRALVGAYNWIFGWQDRLVQRLDAWAAQPLRAASRGEEAERQRDDRRLLTAMSALGPGVQILVLDLYTLAGYRRLGLMLEMYLWTAALGSTAYGLGLLVALRVAAARRSRQAAGG